MRLRFFFWLMACWLICGSMRSQSGYTLSLETVRLVPHNTKFLYEPRGVGIWPQASLYWQTSGSENWHQVYGKPRFGVQLGVMYLGQPAEILGWAYSIYPYVDFGFRHRPSSSWRFIIGSGLAYTPRVYDIKNNPLQNALSLVINNHTTFKLQYERKIDKRSQVLLGFSLNHISNGGIQLPNLGLNFLGVDLAWKRSFAIPDRNELPLATRPESWLRWNFGTSLGFAMRELRTPGGPKLPVYVLSVDAGYRYRPFMAWRLGLESEYHTLAPYFASHTELYPDISSAWRQGFRFQMYGSHEWVIGPLSLETRVGAQLFDLPVLGSKRLFFKLCMQYFIDIPKVRGLQWAPGIALKTHYGVAEYVSMTSAFRFGRSK